MYAAVRVVAEGRSRAPMASARSTNRKLNIHVQHASFSRDFDVLYLECWSSELLAWGTFTPIFDICALFCFRVRLIARTCTYVTDGPTDGQAWPVMRPIS